MLKCFFSFALPRLPVKTSLMPLIENQKKLDDFCASLKGAPFITIDTEFLREKTYYPKLCLIQMSGPDKEAKAIDPLNTGLDLSPVYDLLFDETILKIFHAGRQDLEIFFKETGKVVGPFFDTQIAAMVCGYGDSVGYQGLVQNLTGAQMDKSSQYTNWAQRPLSEKQINYALGDVTHLVDIYLKLAEELDARGRTEWVFQEEEILGDPATYENDPYKAWERIKIRSARPKNLAVLRAVSAWREERAQDKDLPKTWIMRDETLADIASQIPQNVEQLKKIRNMSADMAAGHVGKTILSLIKQTLESDKKDWPQPEKKRTLHSSAAATADILRMLLKVQCLRNDVATKLVASKEDIEQLAMEDKPDIPAMRGWRYEVFGKDALALKNGDLAIGLKGNKISKFKISKNSQTL